MSSTVIAQMSDYINQGKPREAFFLALRNQSDPELSATAHFWFQWALASNLAKAHTWEDSLWQEAAKCSDYTPLIEGDFYRDVALHYVRRGALEAARNCVETAMMLQGGDWNRFAALTMVLGRIQFAAHRFDVALERHSQAEALWRSISDADPVWVHNNSFHLFRAQVAFGGPFLLDRYVRLMADEQRRDRRIQLRLMKYGRYRGLLLGDWLAAQLS
jgi:hypothetical protein